MDVDTVYFAWMNYQLSDIHLITKEQNLSEHSLITYWIPSLHWKYKPIDQRNIELFSASCSTMGFNVALMHPLKSFSTKMMFIYRERNYILLMTTYLTSWKDASDTCREEGGYLPLNGTR